MYARRPKTTPRGCVHWGRRVQIDEPILHGGLATYWFQVPYSGTPAKHLIERSIKKNAPRSYFGRVFQPEVTKIDLVEGVAIVKLTHSIGESS